MSPTAAGTVHQKDNRSSSPAPTGNGPAIDVNIVAISDGVELINHRRRVIHGWPPTDH
jgi:hypothetical protein